MKRPLWNLVNGERPDLYPWIYALDPKGVKRAV